jgi:acylphosphatase
MVVSVCFVVSGQVQGVGFRAATRARARKLGLTGHAVNRPDGRVEVLACGDSNTVEQLFMWLHQGPPLARVDKVERHSRSDFSFDDFTIG